MAKLSLTEEEKNMMSSRAYRLRIAELWVNSHTDIKTKNDLADRMDVSCQMVYSLLSGRIQATERILLRFNKSVGGHFSMLWLLYGEGDMFSKARDMSEERMNRMAEILSDMTESMSSLASNISQLTNEISAIGDK